jgi:hypothetical protein
VDVDFAPPLDYVEPEKPSNQGNIKTEENGQKGSNVFAGNGLRIDEKANNPNARKGSQVVQ